MTFNAAALSEGVVDAVVVVAAAAVVVGDVDDVELSALFK